MKLWEEIKSNCRVKTPPAKKNITNNVEEWVQGVPPPPKKPKSLALTSVTSKVSSVLMKSNKSVSCAVMSVSASQIFPKPSLKPVCKAVCQVKYQAKEPEPEPASDDEYMPPTSTAFEGLEEDKDNTMEWAAALLSPVKASTAAQLSKVSIYTLSWQCTITTQFVELPQHCYQDHISCSRKRPIQENRQQQTSWWCAQTWKVDMCLYPNLSLIYWWPKQGYLGLQITQHCSSSSSNL